MDPFIFCMKTDMLEERPYTSCRMGLCHRQATHEVALGFIPNYDYRQGFAAHVFVCEEHVPEVVRIVREMENARRQVHTASTTVATPQE